MKTHFTLLKSSLMVLFLGLGLSSWGQTITEDFEAQTALKSSYEDGSFIGADGVIFTYVHSRNEALGTSDDSSIDGKGIMLRRANEPSSIEFTLPNGVGNLSFEYRKAFTGGSDRVLAVLVNGVQEYLTPAFGGSSGADATVYTFNENIDEAGPVTIKITYPTGTATGNRQITIDNISWTAFEDVEPEEVPVVTEDVFLGQVGVPFSETILATENPNSYVITAGSLPSGLTLNPSTGEISGTPTEAGDNFEFTIVASNSVGDSDPANFLIAIEKGEQTVASLDDINAYFGAADITLPIETDQGFTLSYATGDSNVATVSGNILTIVGLGTTELYALAEDVNENYEDYIEEFTITVTEEPELDHIVISQVYGGGGNSGASYNRDYIELFNPTNQPININGYALRYASATGNSWSSNVNHILPDVTIQPGKYYLIQTTNSGATGASLPTPDYTFTTNMDIAGANGKLVLWSNSGSLSSNICPTSGSGTIIDFVGFGTANCYEGTGAAPAGSNTTAVIRKNNGNQDTDDNSNDFETGTPNPRNSSFGTAIWENGAWIGTPAIDTDVIIRDLLIVDETNQVSFSAKTLTLEEGGSILIESGSSITVEGAIISNGDFEVEAGANLVQINDVENTGAITVEVKAMTEWFGYNMFSSPVAGQSLGGIFTNGENNGNEYLTYSYTDENTHSWEATTDTAFGLGLGYMFAAPMTAPLGELASYNYEFTGVPNNGTVELSVSESFIAIGNPYPSAIDADEFMSHNNIVGAIHIWRNSHFYNYGVGEYAGVNYITINGLTTVGAEGGNIEAGQGFVVATDAGTIEFTNEMRLAESAGVFYKPASSDKHILWLNLYNENNMLNQIAVGYAEGATEGYDNQMDAKMFGYAGSALYSIITGEQDAYAIQGRSLPFTNTDAVALGFRAAQAGTYTVSLADFNGLFANGQDIYLKDNATQTYHDLKDGAYTFVSEQGIFESRFEVVYQADGELSTNVPTLDNSWIVYSQDNGFQIETQGFELKEVLVYDMLGRLVYNNQAEGTSHTISNIANGVLIVKVITTDNQVLTRKTAK